MANAHAIFNRIVHEYKLTNKQPLNEASVAEAIILAGCIIAEALLNTLVEIDDGRKA